MAAPTIPVSTAIPTEIHPQAANASARERTWNKVLKWITVFVVVGLAAHLVVLLWAQHDFSPVEELVALHSNMFAQGGGLYWDLKSYPFTVSPYGPIFYVVAGYFHKWGMASYQAGRIISFAALLMSLWMCWLGVSRLTTSRYARWVVVILAASTANILFWGTTGQVDMLACCFSLAAFVSFLKYRERGDMKSLALAGLLVVLAVFTKQTFLAAGVTIGLTLLWDAHRRRTSPLAAAVWIASVGFLGVSIALALNAATDGGYFKQAIFANMNPLEWLKLQQHIYYLILTGSGVILTAMVGAWYLSRRTAPLYVYAAFATGIWLLTAPKTGSDLNYQIEMMFVFSMCAACALDQVDFFPSLFSARRTWVTLLQVPLMLHVFLNLLLTGRNVAERVIFDSIKGQETAALKPFVERPGLLLSGQYDALVQYRGRIEVEPYIYILLVRAGIIDPEPLRKDLETRQFATIILGGPLAPGGHAAEENLELVTLPDAQLDAIRRNYRVVKHIDGPHDLYVYEPRRD